jgi:methionyl aminopeptidase
MIKLKTKEEIEIMAEGGKILAEIIRRIGEKVKPGVVTSYLEDEALKIFKELGAKPAFLNYSPQGAKRPYPAALCVSINDEIVHGIPNENPQTLEEGDIVTLDSGVLYKGLITDHAITFPVGEISKENRKLLTVTRESLSSGIKAAVVGGRIGDIGSAIQKHGDNNGYGICDSLCGHGVGYEVHEDPYVPNFGRAGTGDVLEEGMVIAIEPMFTRGTDDVNCLSDGYTYVTSDGSNSAHFEHTVAITKDGPIILTK